MTLEGALGPNSRLEEARAFTVAAPDAICVTSSGPLLFSSGADVFQLSEWGAKPKHWGNFKAPVTALSASPGGLVAVGSLGGGLTVCDSRGKVLPGWNSSAKPRSVADCLFLSEEELAVVDHGFGPDEQLLTLAPWDEMARGQVLAIRKSGQTRVIASELHCPMGITRSRNGELAVTELERARVIDVAGHVLQAGYPAYLGRIRRIGHGYAIACLSRRDPLIEFLKTERDFVARMKSAIDPRHWISPKTNPEFAHDFPIVLGATRLFGEIKPWAPSFSYGLVIETDAALMPIGSAHSRANGIRHAITDVASWNGELIAVSRASAEILNLGPEGNVA